MRVGSTLLLKNGKCFQSYNWKFFRPLGSMQIALDTLNEYECDEVAIIRPARNDDSLNLFSQDLDVLKRSKTMTPISFGGGIRSLAQLNLLESLPIERLIFSSSFIENNSNFIYQASRIFGKQAIQCLLPVKIIDDDTYIYLSNKAEFVGLEKIDFALINELANEVILYDTRNDGYHDCFDETIINKVCFPKHKLIISGGVGKSTIEWARRQGIASVLIDNKVLHREYSIRGFKHGN